MTRGLRKGLTQYRDEGVALFLRRAFIKAAGNSDDRLIVGIASASSDFNPCSGGNVVIGELGFRQLRLVGSGSADTDDLGEQGAQRRAVARPDRSD